MPEYVDGFVLPVPKDKIEEYRKLATIASEVWKEYGALDYRECVAEDMKNEWSVPFPTLAGAKEDETVVFAWITYKSREDRDAINAKVMEDPRLKCSMDGTTPPPFDCKRMAYGGFETLVKI